MALTPTPFDPNISNGTCWYSSDEQADDHYIPCGNSAIRNYACCQIGDTCLTNNACFNAPYGVTYLASCSDQSFQDPSCPDKGQQDLRSQEWVGLVRCFVSNDTDTQDEEWAGCTDTHQPSVESPDPCTCTPGDSNPVFTAGVSLPNVAKLPFAANNVISWFPDYSPPYTQTGTSATSAAFSAIASVSKTLSATSIHATSTMPTNGIDSATSYTAASAGLTTSAKVGLGVGSGVGAIVLISLFGVVAMWTRRRCRRRDKHYPPAMDQIRPRSDIGPYAFTTDAKDEDGSITAEPGHHESWVVPKSELPANEPPARSATNASVPVSVSDNQSPVEQSGYTRYGSPILATSRSNLARNRNGTVMTNSDIPASLRPGQQNVVHELPG